MAAPATIGKPRALDIDDLIRRGQYRDAIAACAREYGESLGRLCMALLGGQGEAEEAVQETFLAAFRSIESYRFEGSVRAWLYTIARRQCAQRLEKRGRRAELALVGDVSDPASNATTARDRARQVRRALDELPPSEREAVVLRYLGQLDYPEIAAALAIPEPAARKRVSRGLARLRLVLEKEDVL